MEDLLFISPLSNSPTMVLSLVSVTKAASPRRRAAPPTLVITKGGTGCILQTQDALCSLVGF